MNVPLPKCRGKSRVACIRVPGKEPLDTGARPCRIVLTVEGSDLAAEQQASALRMNGAGNTAATPATSRALRHEIGAVDAQFLRTGAGLHVGQLLAQTQLLLRDTRLGPTRLGSLLSTSPRTQAESCHHQKPPTIRRWAAVRHALAASEGFGRQMGQEGKQRFALGLVHVGKNLDGHERIYLLAVLADALISQALELLVRPTRQP